MTSDERWSKPVAKHQLFHRHLECQFGKPVGGGETSEMKETAWEPKPRKLLFFKKTLPTNMVQGLMVALKLITSGWSSRFNMDSKRSMATCHCSDFSQELMVALNVMTSWKLFIFKCPSVEDNINYPLIFLKPTIDRLIFWIDVPKFINSTHLGKANLSKLITF